MAVVEDPVPAAAAFVLFFFDKVFGDLESTGLNFLAPVKSYQIFIAAFRKLSYFSSGSPR